MKRKTILSITLTFVLLFWGITALGGYECKNCSDYKEGGYALCETSSSDTLIVYDEGYAFLCYLTVKVESESILCEMEEKDEEETYGTNENEVYLEEDLAEPTQYDSISPSDYVEKNFEVSGVDEQEIAADEVYEEAVSQEESLEATESTCPKCGELEECEFFSANFIIPVRIGFGMTFATGTRLAIDTPVFIVYIDDAEVGRTNIYWTSETTGAGDVSFGISFSFSGYVCQREELTEYNLSRFDMSERLGVLTWRVELPSGIREITPTSGTIASVNPPEGEGGYWYHIAMNVERANSTSGNENNNISNDNAGESGAGASPQTGDTQNIILFFLLFLTSLSVVAQIIAKRKVNEQKG